MSERLLSVVSDMRITYINNDNIIIHNISYYIAQQTVNYPIDLKPDNNIVISTT